MAGIVDTAHSKRAAERCRGASPLGGTNLLAKIIQKKDKRIGHENTNKKTDKIL